MDPASVICLSPIPWDGLWTSRHEISSVLARRGVEVLFVNPPRNLIRRHGTTPVQRPVPAGIRLLDVRPYLPYGAAGRIEGLAARIIDRNARRYAIDVSRGAAHLPRPVVLLNSFVPVLGYRVAARLCPARTIYHRADELRAYPSCRPSYLALETRVARQADAVACVSEAVRAGISTVRPDAAVVPNGVDVGRFAGALPDPRLTGLARPVAIHVGVHDHRIDADLLRAAASADGTLVLAGPVDGAEVPAGAVSLGAVPRDEVPGLLAAADVGLVLYRTWPGDALKAYEYLASGLPVVSGDYPGLGHVRSKVRLANPDTIAAAIADEFHARTAPVDADRRAFAAAQTWDARVDDLLALVEPVTAR